MQSEFALLAEHDNLQRSILAARLFNFQAIQRLQRYTWQDAVLAAWLAPGARPAPMTSPWR